MQNISVLADKQLKLHGLDVNFQILWSVSHMLNHSLDDVEQTYTISSFYNQALANTTHTS